MHAFLKQKLWLTLFCKPEAPSSRYLNGWLHGLTFFSFSRGRRMDFTRNTAKWSSSDIHDGLGFSLGMNFGSIMNYRFSLSRVCVCVVYTHITRHMECVCVVCECVYMSVFVYVVCVGSCGVYVVCVWGCVYMCECMWCVYMWYVYVWVHVVCM